jgi:hypothetical protein
MLTKARMRGIVGGAGILTLFGGFWCIFPLSFWSARPAWAIPAASTLIFALLVVCLLRLRASAKLPDSQDPAEAAKGKHAGRLFGIIFGAEGALIGLASALLGRAGLGDWIPVAAALIVGLHFLPLAHVFEMPLYYWTGALAVFGVLGCLLVHAADARVLCVECFGRPASCCWCKLDPCRPEVSAKGVRQQPQPVCAFVDPSHYGLAGLFCFSPGANGAAG